MLETIDLDIEEASELLFKVKVEGIEPAPAKVRLVCEAGDIAMMFNGHPTAEEGVVQFLLPPMKGRLKEGNYLSRVEVLIENRYFVPVQFNINFKRAVKVVAEAIQVPQRRPVHQVSVTAAPVAVKRPAPVAPPAPTARPIVVEEQAKSQFMPVSKPAKRLAPPPARFNAAMTLKERYNSRLDERKEEDVIEVDESSEDLLRELARSFVRNRRR
jgi:hypothetical protein